MKQFTPPKIVKDEEVKEPPPAVEELKETKIGNINQEGIKDIGIVTPPAAADAGKGLVEAKPVEKEPEVFTKVEVDAKYPGNWRSFLERNLDGQVAVDNGASPGTYTVIIQFIVDVAGNVSDVKALTKQGHGMEEEAMRVIKRSGKWQPAVQNGREVKAYRKQPITFQVTDQ
ncbi:energy transducer TonB [Niabella ginsengisoli]|uniref:Energy transducer TonB n=1 Tax=Niabella ginsengisoli TaxID=522298 RepID=A0ABS9SE74_9BACT|nr:energy transducer TonB [Niabella ginsengisoli]MCH5596650.1 energy transducer TonB [Niabella ginsengisoli]